MELADLSPTMRGALKSVLGDGGPTYVTEYDRDPHLWVRAENKRTCEALVRRGLLLNCQVDYPIGGYRGRLTAEGIRLRTELLGPLPEPHRLPELERFDAAHEASRRKATDRRKGPRRASEAVVHYAREALIAAALEVDENAEGAVNSWCVLGPPAEQFGQAVAAYRAAIAADLEAL